MKKIINGLLFLAVFVGVSGCGASAKNFENTSWSFKEVVDSKYPKDSYMYREHNNHTVKETFTFYEGGAANYEHICVTDNDVIESRSSTWEVDGQYLKVNTGGLFNETYVFKIDGDQLVDTSDSDFILVKNK